MDAFLCSVTPRPHTIRRCTVHGLTGVSTVGSRQWSFKEMPEWASATLSSSDSLTIRCTVGYEELESSHDMLTRRHGA